jgi:AraC-like DNA-binding protein
MKYLSYKAAVHLEDLMNKLNNEFSFSILSKLDAEENEKMVYKINSEFGKGKIVLYKVVNGLYVILWDCIILNNKSEESQAFHSKAGIFYKLFEGKFFISIKNRKAIVINKGDIVNFFGDSRDRVVECKHFGERVLSLGLYFYYDELVHSLSQNLFDSAALKEYIHDERIRQILVYKKDAQIEKVLSDLWLVVQADNRFLIKTKAIELIYYVTNNYKNHFYDSKKKYDKRLISQVIEMKNFLDTNSNRYFTIPELAKKFGISQTYAKEIFKDLYGSTIYQYHLAQRLEEARKLLTEKTDAKISEIALQTGFSSSSKFTHAFKKRYGLLPSHLRS